MNTKIHTSESLKAQDDATLKVHYRRLAIAGSYIVLDKETDQVVTELFNKHLASKVNIEKYYVMTAYDYLCRLNKQMKN